MGKVYLNHCCHIEQGYRLSLTCPGNTIGTGQNSWTSCTLGHIIKKRSTCCFGRPTYTRIPQSEEVGKHIIIIQEFEQKQQLVISEFYIYSSINQRICVYMHVFLSICISIFAYLYGKILFKHTSRK